MNPTRPTALIADDEPLLRKSLARLLNAAWPELEIVALARNGREAVEKFEQFRPDVCFLDVHMPGLSGVEAARQIGRRAQLVFVTAFDRYAVQAFEHGALDYLMKPVETARLADTVARLQERLRAPQPRADIDALLEQIASHLQKKLVAPATPPIAPPRDEPAAAPSAAPLRWIRASVGQSLRLIAVDDIDYLRSDEKYTRIAWHDDAGKPADALVRTPLKDLLAQLDANQFAQTHRSVVVNLHAIRHVTRGDNETALVHLKHRAERLPVSRSYLHLFRQM
ncbi:MAG TPA: LytTR family DNA-binding domain-containing protein [Tahibacter sp.]|uniref:LytR/AlgR family response regulator transcription factor n=1 Tax=Tahibacter sp. TaxID=2056211 RepID=UPI002B6109E4|nr:LytTR family DNA-binding domain-containing protein [Tahibacter sp.]HSX59042.1 LytTR family DNA-binding domain-containing protein [Tahibacter sp.]